MAASCRWHNGMRANIVKTIDTINPWSRKMKKIRLPVLPRTLPAVCAGA
jgi:predicted methyltransferase